jgi:hypothetical protein
MRLRSWIIGDGETRIRFLEPTIPQRPLLESEGKGCGLVSYCFENCWDAILPEYEKGSHEFTYVEGHAVLQPLTSLPHAWLLDRDGCVVETSFLPWQITLGSAFVGFVLPRSKHIQRVKAACRVAERTGAVECNILTPQERARAKEACMRLVCPISSRLPAGSPRWPPP